MHRILKLHISTGYININTLARQRLSHFICSVHHIIKILRPFYTKAKGAISCSVTLWQCVNLYRKMCSSKNGEVGCRCCCFQTFHTQLLREDWAEREGGLPLSGQMLAQDNIAILCDWPRAETKVFKTTSVFLDFPFCAHSVSVCDCVWAFRPEMLGCRSCFHRSSS